MSLYNRPNPASPGIRNFREQIMKVVVTSLLGDGFEESLLEEFPSLDLVFALTEEDQAKEIRDADVFMGEPTRDVFIEANVFDGCIVRALG